MQDNSSGEGENPDVSEQVRDKWTESYDVNPHYHQLLVTHAAKNVIDEIEARNNRSRNLIITGLSAVIALLVTIGGFLLNELLDVRIEARVNSAMAKELSQARLGVDVARLSFQAAKIDLEQDFDEQEAISAIEKLGVWYADYVANPEVSAAERVASKALISEPAVLLLDIFAGMHRLDLCFRLLEAAPQIFEDDPDGSYYFSTSLADRVLSEPGAPQAWFESESEIGRYYVLLKSQLNKLNYRSFPEVAILTNALMNHIEDPEDVASVKRRLARYETLNATDRMSFDTKVENFIDGGFIFELDREEGQLIRERTLSMLTAVCPLDVFARHCETLTRINASQSGEAADPAEAD